MMWSISPGEGLGPLRLGMTQDAVAALPMMGKPQHVYRGSGGQQMEYRGLRLPICEYETGVLTRIVTGRHVAGVRFEGIDLFDGDPEQVTRRLESALGPAALCNEQLCFLKGGISLGGFYDANDHDFFAPEIEYHDERCVTLYAPGACPGDCREGEPLSFL
ncbi:hypothetical protein SAMN05444722_1739 [Rhodovulum sp. ES.010]|uniref:hypothetical protein n=1 Tax=Rhodovulum sp. ES.010 TaxID=1882821 RepID=UPI00092C709D|nr:hypothetical protein [Rhodovulum sp. ES.010]SIO37381.1 hypothetical protein SAMN05444722_1739 [Rhodovulum sp. ES.010]